MFCRVIPRAIAVERVKALVKQWLSPSLYVYDLGSKSAFLGSGLTRKVAVKPLKPDVKKPGCEGVQLLT